MTPLMGYLDFMGFAPSPLGGGMEGRELILGLGGNHKIVVTDLEGFALPDNQGEGWLIRVFDATATDYDAALLESMDSESYRFSGPCLALCKAIHRHEPQGRTLAEKVTREAVAKMCDNGANPMALAKQFADKLQAHLSPADWQEMRRRNALPDYAETGACASHDFCDANLIMCDAFAAFGIDAIGDSDAPAGSPEDYRREAVARLWNQAWEITKRDSLTAQRVELASMEQGQ